MNMNRLTILLAAASLFLVGCGGAGEKAGGDNAKASAPSNVGAAASTAPTSAGNVNAAPTNNGATAADARTPQTTVAAAAPRAGATPSSNTRVVNNAPPAKMPEPQLGSGGNDFYLFTQARGALNADAELKTANLVLDVKAGVVTLSGTVASAAQKSKAEELVRSVGAKSVKNQLRVAAAN